MEKSNEIKARVLLPYIGLECEYKWNREDRLLFGKLTPRILESLYYNDGVITYCKVKLKPLSSILDEDAIMCYVITDRRNGIVNDNEYFTHRYKNSSTKSELVSIDIRRIDVKDECLNIGFDGTIVFYNDEKTPTMERIKNQIQVFQFLQSKGYDLPQYLLEGKTLNECNLAIYE